MKFIFLYFSIISVFLNCSYKYNDIECYSLTHYFPQMNEKGTISGRKLIHTKIYKRNSDFLIENFDTYNRFEPDTQYSFFKNSYFMYKKQDKYGKYFKDNIVNKYDQLEVDSFLKKQWYIHFGFDKILPTSNIIFSKIEINKNLNLKIFKYIIEAKKNPKKTGELILQYFKSSEKRTVSLCESLDTLKGYYLNQIIVTTNQQKYNDFTIDGFSDTIRIEKVLNFDKKNVNKYFENKVQF